MAFNKDKLLESAQRFVLKGQIDRAIRDYQQVVALEPREIRYRQRLAELLVRVGRKEEAIAQYEDIGKHYSDNLYFLKAIAVYKQIQRLAPGDTSVMLTLASLNHKQGLTGNALAEYGQVVNALEKEGNLKQAVQVLEQMIEMDGDNLSTRLKYADLLRTTGAEDLSYQAYRDILSVLRTQGDDAALLRFQAQMRHMFPQRELTGAELAGRMMAEGDLEGAVAALHRMLQDDRSDRKLWRLLCDAKREQGDPAGLRLAYRQMSEAFPEDLSLLSEAVCCSFDTGADQEGMELLHPHLDRLIAAGRWEESRQLLEKVPPRLASDPRLREGMRLLEGDAPPPDDSFACAMEIDLPPELLEELALADDPFAPPPSSAGAAPDREAGYLELAPSPWEVEIELDLDEEPEPVRATSPLPEVKEFDPTLDFGAALLDASAPEEGALELTLADAADPLLLLEEVAEPAPGWGDGTRGEEAAPGVDAAVPAAPLKGMRWEELFPDWGAPVAGSVEPEELESHYDLGIAYREMGLYAEAVREFRVAAGNPRRRMDCLTLQALCYRDQGDTATAKELLEKGIALAGVSAEERIGVTYELAYLHEKLGNLDEALRLYDEVYSRDSGYHDVAHKMACLAGMDELLDVIDLVLEEDAEEEPATC